MKSCRGCTHRHGLNGECDKCVDWDRYRGVSPEFKHTVCSPDISKEMEKIVNTMLNNIFGVKIVERKNGMRIEKVIFNAPATIVIWKDGTKTVVKSGDYDVYDPEKGLAMAIAKKALGNQGNYYEVFKQWLPEEYERTSETVRSEITMDGNGTLNLTVESGAEKAKKDLSNIEAAIKEVERFEDNDTYATEAIEVLPDRTTGIILAASSKVQILTPVQMARLLHTSDTEIQKRCREEWSTYAKKVNGKWLIPCVVRDVE